MTGPPARLRLAGGGPVPQFISNLVGDASREYLAASGQSKIRDHILTTSTVLLETLTSVEPNQITGLVRSTSVTIWT